MPAHRSSRPAWAALFLAAVLLAFGAATAGAHSELSEARPGAGQEVGGTIDKIELEFRSPITDAEIRVFDPQNEELTGPEHTEVDGTIATQEIETITTPGQHQVTYKVIALDGDAQDNAYVFTYDPDAPGLPSEDTGGSTILLWAFVVISVAILGFGYTRLRRGDEGADTSGE